MAYSVLDYIRGGCSLKFMVAIDFTVSVRFEWLRLCLHSFLVFIMILLFFCFSLQMVTKMIPCLYTTLGTRK